MTDPDLKRAKEYLQTQGCTCVLCRGERMHTSLLRGVAPLLNFLDAGTDLAGFAAADKVVGKATAFLYCLLDVRAVWAGVMSRSALQVLGEHGIEAHYDCLTDAIRNRRQDGFCPMETATRDLQDPHRALEAIRTTLKRLQASK